MKRFCVLFLILMLLLSSAAADPVTSYAEVQDRLLAAAYKVPIFDAALSGTISEIVHSYTFSNAYYLFVMVDPDDVSMWSTEDDNYFVTCLYSEDDPLPFVVGDNVIVEGRIASIYSSPVCPYITCDNISKSE